jgi:hypothetical protein
VFGWLKSLWSRRPKPRSSIVPPPPARWYVPVYIPIPQYTGSGDPPPLHWKACHPSTVRLFKAEMTCSEGHGLVLKAHSIAADGRVSPSVVCLARGCSFHEYVCLHDWQFGRVG